MTLGTESLTEEEASRWEYLVQDSVWYSPLWSEKKKDKHNRSKRYNYIILLYSMYYRMMSHKAVGKIF